MKKNIRNKYMKELKNSLVYIGKTEKKSFYILNREIELYIDKDTTYNDLVTHFGKPEELADSFIEGYDDITLKKKIKSKKLVIVISVISVILTVLIISLVITEYFKSRNSYITREVEVLTEK